MRQIFVLATLLAGTAGLIACDKGTVVLNGASEVPSRVPVTGFPEVRAEPAFVQRGCLHKSDNRIDCPN